MKRTYQFDDVTEKRQRLSSVKRYLFKKQKKQRNGEVDAIVNECDEQCLVFTIYATYPSISVEL